MPFVTPQSNQENEQAKVTQMIKKRRRPTTNIFRYVPIYKLEIHFPLDINVR